MRTSLASLLLISIFLASCAVNPVTGERELSFISAEGEVKMGEQNYVPYQQQQGGRYVVDPNLGAYINQVGQRLAALSDRPGLPYEFVVLNNSVPNAWALPGGKIAVNRGLLMELEDEAQLAAVLSHEIVHAAGKHSVKQMQQAQILGVAVLATAALTKDSDYGEMATMGAGLGAGLWNAKYGRDQELQSDSVGIRYMVAAGYDPSAAVDLQETFVRLSAARGGNSNWLNGLFASHPPSQERVDRNRALAEELGARGERRRNAYQQAIAQLTKDQKAYDNYDKAIAAAQEKKWDTALGLLASAQKQQPDDAIFYATEGQILLQQNKSSGAAKAFSKAASLNPEYYVGHLGLGLVQFEQQRREQAKQSFARSMQLLPTQTATFYLGEIALAEGDREAAARYFQSAASQGGELGNRANSRLQSMGFTQPQG